MIGEGFINQGSTLSCPRLILGRVPALYNVQVLLATDQTCSKISAVALHGSKNRREHAEFQ